MKISDLGLTAVRALFFTKENIDAGFGIWDAGMSLSATIVTGSHVLNGRLDWTIRVSMTDWGVWEYVIAVQQLPCCNPI